MSNKREDVEQFITVEYADEMKKSYIDYAMSVIKTRALPDVRDGLKPVHRRILYAMLQLGLTPDKTYRKCARIVGDALGKYHPHGDASVYDALVRMAQDFRMGATLVDGHGNFGSVDGDSAAAMRYTEAKLTEIATYMLQDLDKNVIDFADNFDGTENEPSVLPAKYPNLLINGTTGIAVGMATNIPPHNISEVVDATIAYIDNKNITIDKLLEYIKGPDYPSGAVITNKDEVLEFYKTGSAKAVIRSRVEIESAGYGRSNIIVTEIPYTCSGNKTKLVNDIIDQVNGKVLDEIVDVRDESSKDGTRIVLEVKKGVNIDNLLNKLYKKTKLQDQDKYTFLVLDNKEPKVINLLQYMEYYVEFQKEILKRKYSYLLNKAEERKEILEGLVRATNVIDIIIEALRGSKDVKMVRECLMYGKTEGINWKSKKSEKMARTFDFTENQTTAILEMRLQKLISLEVEKLISDFEDTKKNIEEYKEIISSEKKQLSIMKIYLREFKKKFSIPRKTSVINSKTEEYKEEFREEELYVLVDKFGYVKSVDKASVSRTAQDVLAEFKYCLETKNTEKLAVFTNKGFVHQIKLLDIPKGKVKDRGTPVEVLCKLESGEYPVKIATSSELKDRQCLITTKNGLIKVAECTEYETNRTTIASTKLDNNDEVMSLEILPREGDSAVKDVALITRDGYVIKFNIDEVPLMKKNSKGVKAIDIYEGSDNVSDVILLSGEPEFKTKVNGKEVDIVALRRKRRGKKGSLV